jgi:hypothetical protein
VAVTKRKINLKTARAVDLLAREAERGSRTRMFVSPSKKYLHSR